MGKNAERFWRTRLGKLENQVLLAEASVARQRKQPIKISVDKKTLDKIEKEADESINKKNRMYSYEIQGLTRDDLEFENSMSKDLLTESLSVFLPERVAISIGAFSAKMQDALQVISHYKDFDYAVSQSNRRTKQLFDRYTEGRKRLALSSKKTQTYIEQLKHIVNESKRQGSIGQIGQVMIKDQHKKDQIVEKLTAVQSALQFEKGDYDLNYIVNNIPHKDPFGRLIPLPVLVKILESKYNFLSLAKTELLKVMANKNLLDKIVKTTNARELKKATNEISVILNNCFISLMASNAFKLKISDEYRPYRANPNNPPLYDTGVMAKNIRWVLTNERASISKVWKTGIDPIHIDKNKIGGFKNNLSQQILAQKIRDKVLSNKEIKAFREVIIATQSVGNNIGRYSKRYNATRLANYHIKKLQRI